VSGTAPAVAHAISGSLEIAMIDAQVGYSRLAIGPANARPRQGDGHE
jgi:hypothetical protein